MTTDEQDKGPLRLEASRGGISISIDLPRLLLDNRTLGTIMEDGKTLRQILEEIVEIPQGRPWKMRSIFSSKRPPLAKRGTGPRASIHT